MRSKSKIFNVGSLVFWVSLGLILFFSLPFFKDGFYDDQSYKKYIATLDLSKQEEQKDEVSKNDSADFKTLRWSWTDYGGNSHNILFTSKLSSLRKAVKYRSSYSAFFNSYSDICADFINVSMPVIDSMAAAMQSNMSIMNITGAKQLEYVVTAVQQPTYTKIAVDNECPCIDMGRKWLNDCNARKDGKGCCNNVRPIGLFTPAEFIFQKTGDCDTKALLAYALLKKMNFDVALITGDTELGPHAMLAVANIRPKVYSQFVSKHGIKYYPWEVTSKSPDNILGNITMWKTWQNWTVVLN